MSKNINAYFKDFIAMMDCSCQAAALFMETIQHFDPESLPQKREAMHRIENTEDKMKHVILERLVKEFVPPIDREDIIQLANELDDVTDQIEDVLIRLDTYNIKQMHPAVLDFARVIVRCCDTLKDAISEFPNFRKSTILRQSLIKVNHLEEECDAIYIESIRNLFRSSYDVLDIMKWSNLFEKLEECCDACENVSDIMDIIIMKNS